MKKQLHHHHYRPKLPAETLPQVFIHSSSHLATLVLQRMYPFIFLNENVYFGYSCVISSTVGFLPYFFLNQSCRTTLYIYTHDENSMSGNHTRNIYIYGLQYIILVNLLPRWGACFLLVTTGEKFFFMKSLNHLLLTNKPFFFFLAGKSKKIQKGVLEILYDLWIVCGSALYYMCSNVQSNTIKDIQRYIRFGATPTCLANTIIKICWFSHLDEDGYHRLPYI